MSDYKCEASHEGICHNVYGYGTKCSGYSKECQLRQHYEKLSNAARGLERAIKNALGIKGDGQ